MQGKVVYEVKSVEKGKNNYPATRGVILTYGENGKTLDSFSGISGFWGKGCTPIGIYTYGEVVVLPDVETNKWCRGETCCWYVRLTPVTKVEGRTGLLFHPDGNVPGTEGCTSTIKGEKDDRLKEYFKLYKGGTFIVK